MSGDEGARTDATSEAPPPLPPDPSLGTQRLHPLTVPFAILQVLKPWALPALVFVVLGRGSGLTFVGAVVIGPALVLAVLRYATFTYRLAGGELVIRHGLFSRTERHVPLERIQDLRLEQGLLQRWLGVGALHVDTAGGEGPEATLSVISRHEAERLRTLLGARRRAAAPDAPAPPPARVVRRVSFRELVLAGVTSLRIASVFVAVAAFLSLVQELTGNDVAEQGAQRVTEAATRVAGAGRAEVAVGIVAGLALVLAAAVVLSVTASIVLFHGFSLSEREGELTRTYGLLTRRQITLPRRRIQVLEVEQLALRRLVGLASIRADTAGSSREGARAGGRDVLLPVVPRSEVPSLLPVFFPDMGTAEPDWQPVSRLAVRRGNVKALLLALLAAAALAAAGAGLAALVPLALLPAAHGWNVLRWRALAHATDRTYFFTRSGVLRRSTHVVPVRNVQAVELRQSPFDRRLGLATIVVDTAGQAFTGGGPRVANIPVAEATRIAEELARGAVRTRFAWS